MTSLRPVLPKEHGLWVWVLVPLLVGAGSAVGDAGNFWTVFAAVLLWFLALTPARMVYKSRKKKMALNRAALVWSFVYGFPGTVAVLLAVMADYRFIVYFAFLAPSFYIGVRAAHAGYLKSVAFEFGGIAYLSLLAFLGAFSVAGDFQTAHAAVWFLVLVFLMDRSVQTRRVARTIGRTDGKSPERLKPICRKNVLISLGVLLTVFLFLILFGLPRIFVLPYLPGMAATLYNYARPPRLLKHVGYMELFLAVLYSAAITLLSGSLYQ